MICSLLHTLIATSFSELLSLARYTVEKDPSPINLPKIHRCLESVLSLCIYMLLYLPKRKSVSAFFRGPEDPPPDMMSVALYPLLRLSATMYLFRLSWIITHHIASLQPLLICDQGSAGFIITPHLGFRSVENCKGTSPAGQILMTACQKSYLELLDFGFLMHCSSELDLNFLTPIPFQFFRSTCNQEWTLEWVEPVVCWLLTALRRRIPSFCSSRLCRPAGQYAHCTVSRKLLGHSSL